MKKMSEKPIISIPFKFSPQANDWFETNLQQFVDEFNEVFPENGGIFLRRHHKFSKLFQITPPCVQVYELLKTIGLTNFYCNLIVYKKLDNSHKVKPHIDVPDTINPLPCRFNVLIRGDSNSSMIWWNKSINDTNDIAKEQTLIGYRYQVKNKEILEYPYYVEKNLSEINKTADFVRTEILHSIHKSGQERVLLSAEISEPWEKIYECVKRYKEKINVL